MSVSLIYDDSNPKFTYWGNQWTHKANTDYVYNNTISTCDTTFHNSSTTTASFTMYFWGTDINVYGPIVAGSAFNYTIDSTSVRPAEINTNSIAMRGGQIWSLQGLDNTTYHTLEIFPSAGAFSFDYMTYTPVRSTTIAGYDFILDDADDTISYSSGWTAASSGSYGDVIPYKGTVTSTGTAGSTMKFSFIGASISVYGLLNQNPGKLSASFSVDGGSTTVYSPFDGSQSVSANKWSPNQLFFHQDLVPGNHTVSVKVTEVTGSQALYIDSLVFEATATTPISKADASAKAAATNRTSTTSSGGLSNGVYAGIGVAAVAALFMFYWIKGRYKAFMKSLAAAHRARNNMTPPPSRPPVLRRPRQPIPSSLSAAEDGAAAPLAAPFPTPSPGWNYPPPFSSHGVNGPPFHHDDPGTQMEMRSSRLNDSANESTIPLLMPMPFVPVVGPSPRRESTPPLVDVSPTSPLVPQHQDGSDGSPGMRAHPPPTLASTAGDARASINIPTTTTSHTPQQSQSQQPLLGSTQAPQGSGKQQPVVLTYPTPSSESAVMSHPSTMASGSRLPPQRSETINSDAPPPYTDGS